MSTTEQRVALVTGAARGIGLAAAKRFLADDWRVALLDIDGDNLARTYAALGKTDTTMAITCDVADPAGVARAVASVKDRFGRLDALVNNASAFFPTPVGTATVAQWNELFASNAQAPFFLAQAATPALRAAHGAIVNLVDIYAERALANHPIYCMAKAALAAMTRALALDLAPDIRVNGVAPGAVLWPSDGKPYDDQQSMLARTPLQRAGSPEDVAGAVLWLLHDAPYVTGQIIRVDGGRTLTV